MLAIYILEYKFPENKAVWDMIVSKAKKWVKEQQMSDERRKEVERRTKEYVQSQTDEEQLEALMAL
jgi:hypothetical protein